MLINFELIDGLLAHISKFTTQKVLIILFLIKNFAKSSKLKF